MYHCHLCIYLTGHWNNTFKIIREMLPLGAFKHEFLESDRPKPELASKADLILAGFEDLDIDLREALADLASGKKKACELILLADREQIAGITDHLSDITDIWTMPGRPASIWRLPLTMYPIWFGTRTKMVSTKRSMTAFAGQSTRPKRR